MKVFFLILMMSCSVSVLAADNAAITQLAGDVQIFSHPGKAVAGPAPHARFEGEFFSVQQAKVGDRVGTGHIIRTGISGQARLVYDNGDQINIGSGTAYRVLDASQSQLKLMYGKFRGVISKDGPRKRLTIRTNSATMGVRGTDFFISDEGPAGGTEVSVLRGQVQVDVPAKSEPVAVKPGFIATVASKSDQEKSEGKAAVDLKAKIVDVRKADRADLMDVLKTSHIDEDDQVEAAQNVKGEVAKLETKAKEMTLKDIKTGDSKLFAKISSQSKLDATQINASVVSESYKTAPLPAAERAKSQLDNLGDDAYKKYFKIEN